MANEHRIAGSPGTLPQSGGTPPTIDPTPPREATARLVRENGNLFAVRGGMRIPVTDPGNLLGTAPPPAVVAPPARRTTIPGVEALAPAVAAVRKNRGSLLEKPGIFGIRAGYLFKDGTITKTPAIVLAVGRTPGTKLNKPEIKTRLDIPNYLDGIPVDFEPADPYQQLSWTGGTEAIPVTRSPRLLIDEIQSEDEALEGVPIITYQPPAGGNLEPVTGAMTITCHVSPDAGWRVLQPFLQATERKLHLGMYDFTAPHIYKTVRALLKTYGVEWQQVLGPKESLPAEGDADSTKVDDLPEKSIVLGLKRVAGERFANVFARVGAGRTFASAYHIKVAVRDDNALWLSSGNWQSSNQPNIDFFDESADRQLIQRYNREWHIVCENPTLAKRFQRFLDHDFETASSHEEMEVNPAVLPELMVSEDDLLEQERGAVGLEVFAPQKFVFTADKPLTVQPILTPDNYLDVVLKFLKKRPSSRLYFQNQSLNPIQSPTTEYAELLELLAEYSNDTRLDVKIIFRNIGPVRKKVESLQAAGFNMSKVKMQAGCHTKGIIIDSKAILLGSHNITNQGVQANRDASLLIEDPGIARYYEKIFLHDWDKLAKHTIREESVPVLVSPEEAAPQSELIRVPFSSYEEE